MVGVHRVRIVLHGIRLAAVVVERAEEARKLAHLIVAEVVGRDALGRAELHIGVIRAQRRPVVVGAEIDVLRPVGHHHVVQGDRFYILPHSRQNILLGLRLVAAGYVAEQLIRQRDAAGQGDGHGVHLAHAAETVRHGVDRGLVLLRQRAHIVVHFISGAAHHIHAAGLIGLVAGGDHIGGRRLRGGHAGLILAALIGIRVVGIARCVLLVAALGAVAGILSVRLGDGRRIGVLVRGLLAAEHIGADGQYRHHQRRRRDQQQHGAAGASAPPLIPGAHPTNSLMTALAVSVSLVTHSTTQVP